MIHHGAFWIHGTLLRSFDRTFCLKLPDMAGTRTGSILPMNDDLVEKADEILAHLKECSGKRRQAIRKTRGQDPQSGNRQDTAYDYPRPTRDRRRKRFRSLEEQPGLGRNLSA